MTTGAMHVAMLEFFRGRLAHPDDFDIEMQGLVRQRVVAVRDHHVADPPVTVQSHTILGSRRELHALLGLPRPGGARWHALGQASSAVAFRRWSDHHRTVAVLLPLERLLS